MKLNQMKLAARGLGIAMLATLPASAGWYGRTSGAGCIPMFPNGTTVQYSTNGTIYNNATYSTPVICQASPATIGSVGTNAWATAYTFRTGTYCVEYVSDYTTGRQMFWATGTSSSNGTYNYASMMTTGAVANAMISVYCNLQSIGPGYAYDGINAVNILTN